MAGPGDRVETDQSVGLSGTTTQIPSVDDRRECVISLRSGALGSFERQCQSTGRSLRKRSYAGTDHLYHPRRRYRRATESAHGGPGQAGRALRRPLSNAELGDDITSVPPQMRTGDSWSVGTADAIDRIDYATMLQQHCDSGADLTVACLTVALEPARRSTRSCFRTCGSKQAPPSRIRCCSSE